MVTHCICFHKSFAELQALMRLRGLSTFDEIKCHALFGENCKMCVPYVKKMIETGETVFPILPMSVSAETAPQ
jgi:NAD(P)H-nitrite reductase large subunit